MTKPKPCPRYAIYWAPPAQSELARLGEAWLGRESATDRAIERPCLKGFAREALDEITAEPRRYGLHATLKAPFRLASEWSEAALDTTLADFASVQHAVSGPALRLERIGQFLALTPVGPSPELDLLAQACVERFDSARAAPEPDDLARRRSAQLTSEQETNLLLWGYPYVMRNYRFHVTLTGPLDHDGAGLLMPVLAKVFAPVTISPLEVREIALFAEPGPCTPFRLLKRYALQDTVGNPTKQASTPCPATAARRHPRPKG